MYQLLYTYSELQDVCFSVIYTLTRVYTSVCLAHCIGQISLNVKFTGVALYVSKLNCELHITILFEIVLYEFVC